MKWYMININDYTENQYCEWYNLMTEEKRKRVDKYKSEKDKKCTVFGEMLVKKALSQFCDIRVEDIVFENAEHGKPYAKGLDMHFNISHSGDVVVCAVSRKPVGIDVECIRLVDLRIAKRVCNEDELCYLFGHKPQEVEFTLTDDREILERFFKLWTAKEAYVKCIGDGISKGLMHTPVCDNIIDNNCVISIYQKA